MATILIYVVASGSKTMAKKIKKKQPAKHPRPVNHPPRATTAPHQPLRSRGVRRPPGDPVALPSPHARFEPPPATEAQVLTLSLGTVDAVEERRIAAAGKLVFHTVGDTGGIHGTDVQEAISHEMEAQYDAAADDDKPAFLYHLGDVIYFNGESTLYRDQFYEPYTLYQPHIFAIAGNHDGDTHVRPGDPADPEATLFGFMSNFCDSQPRFDFDPHRPTMTQPYVYWTLDTPLATFIGLYSNVDGLLDARGRNDQQLWLQGQLAAAPTDKCLLVAVHHPPYSLDAVKGGAPDIGAALDSAFTAAGRVPDAVFSGHVHSYQRFTRVLDGRQIPYLVIGAGGYANTSRLLHKIETDASGDPLPAGFQTTVSGLTLESFDDQEPGFMRVTIDSRTMHGEYFTVPFDGSATASVDSFTLNWRTHKITTP
jgi:hypothetical protein